MTPRDPADFADEIASHLAHESDRLAATGMSPDDAAAAARRQFGNVTAQQEAQWAKAPSRAVRLRWGLAFRRVCRTPVFSFSAIAIIAGTFAALTLVASLLYSVKVRSLGVGHPAQLVGVWANDDVHATGPEQDVVPEDMLRAWRESQHSLASLTAYYPLRIKVPDQFEREFVGTVVDGNYFHTLQLPVARGRVILPADDDDDAASVVVLSDAKWRAEFHADPAIIGKPVVLNGTGYIVVGVTPPAADGLDIPAWLSHPGRAVWRQPDSYYYVIGRLRPGQTIARASADLSALIPRSSTGTVRSPNRGALLLGFEASDRTLQAESLLMIGAIVILALVALLNLAALHVVRGMARTRQMAISLAIGATPARLLADAALEGTLLGVAGGLGGITLAAWLRVVLQSFISTHVTTSSAILPLPWMIILVMAGGAALAGAVVAMAGVGVTRSINLATWLHGGDGGSRQHSRWRVGLVAAQVAVAMLSAVAAARLIASVEYIAHLDVGFESDHLLVAELPVWDTPMGSDSGAARLVDRIVPAIAATPGLGRTAVWATIGFRLPRGPDDKLVAIEGSDANYSVRCSWSTCPTDVEAVNQDLFNVFGIPLRHGRSFGSTDRGGPPVAIINVQAQRAWFGGADPIGRRIQIRGSDAPDDWRTIVGVVANSAQLNPMARAPKMRGPDETQPLIYIPVSQARLHQAGLFMGYPLSIAVRPQLPRGPATAALRHALLSKGPDLPLQNILSMTQVFDQGFAEAPVRLNAAVVSTITAITLLLALVGIGGAIAESVRQRTRELGVRLALGSGRLAVAVLVCRRALALALGGAALGTGAAVIFQTTMARVAFGGAPSARPQGVLLWGPNTAVLSFAAATGVILLIASLATLAPALRAARLDPAAVLRADSH